MPGPEVTPGPLPFASVSAGVLHHLVPRQAPVAVADRSPLAQVVNGRGGGTVRLVAEPAARAARAASRAPQHAAQATGTGAAASPAL